MSMNPWLLELVAAEKHLDMAREVKLRRSNRERVGWHTAGRRPALARWTGRLLVYAGTHLAGGSLHVAAPLRMARQSSVEAA
jgi:hypothetical protein